jgi:hypothetical protein
MVDANSIPATGMNDCQTSSPGFNSGQSQPKLVSYMPRVQQESVPSQSEQGPHEQAGNSPPFHSVSSTIGHNSHSDHTVPEIPTQNEKGPNQN